MTDADRYHQWEAKCTPCGYKKLFLLMIAFFILGIGMAQARPLGESYVMTNQETPSAIQKHYIPVENPHVDVKDQELKHSNDGKHKDKYWQEKSKHQDYEDRLDRERQEHNIIRTVTVIPSGFSSILANDQVYYYQEGAFYLLDNQNLVPAAAPLGAVVNEIPTSRDYQIIDGRGYNIVNGIYFVMTSDGTYQVVQPPPGVSSSQDALETSVNDSDDSELPSVAQLVVMYGQ